MPYAIFSPETMLGGSLGNTGNLGREYPWGHANALDPTHSDFQALKMAIVGEFATVS
jgi:septin family protein